MLTAVGDALTDVGDVSASAQPTTLWFCLLIDLDRPFQSPRRNSSCQNCSFPPPLASLALSVLIPENDEERGRREKAAGSMKMAPSKEEKAKPGEASLRVTRSMAHSKTRTSSEAPEEKLATLHPRQKKKKTTAARKNVEEVLTSERLEEGADAAEKEKIEDIGAVVASNKIVIEHCKQCNAFKTRAIQVKSGLEKGVPGITVELNPEKPRRGCFEVRQDGGEIFISLLGMKRPFTPMKSLDMDEVIADVIKKIK